jgi:hypothetical protein
VLARTFQPAFEKDPGQRILIDNLICSTTEDLVGYYCSKPYDTRISNEMRPMRKVPPESYGFVEFPTGSPIMRSPDLVEAAMKNPGKLSTGGPGAWGIMERIPPILNKVAGIKAQCGPFAGAGPSKVTQPPVLS